MITFFTKGQKVFPTKRSINFDELNHSVVLYLMNPQNKCIGLYDPETELSQLIEAVITDVTYDLKQTYKIRRWLSLYLY